MSKYDYEFFNYVVQYEKKGLTVIEPILNEKTFDCEDDAMRFAKEMVDENFSVCVKKVCCAVNWYEVALLDNGDITSSNE